MKTSAGFSLIELMVAVIIIGVLLATGMPSLMTFIQNTQIRSAGENMQAGVSLARSEALRRNARVTLWIVSDTSAGCARTNTGTSWVVSLDDPAGSCNAAASATTAPRLVQARSGREQGNSVNVTATSSGGGGSSCITFNGFGGVENECTGGGNPISQIAFVSSQSASTTRDLQVRITSGGATRMCDPDVAASTHPIGC